MNSIVELRESLNAMFTALKDGEVDVKVAAEMNNTAGKIINTCKVQIEYAQLREEKPSIPYLE